MEFTIVGGYKSMSHGYAGQRGGKTEKEGDNIDQARQIQGFSGLKVAKSL